MANTDVISDKIDNIKITDDSEVCICNSLDEYLVFFKNDYDKILKDVRNKLALLSLKNDTVVDSIIDNKELIELYACVTYCKEQMLMQRIQNAFPTEGFVFQVGKQYTDLITICHTVKPKKILEIGYLCGSSSIVFLENTDADVISIDIKYMDYSRLSKEFIDKEYPGRHKLIIESSAIYLYSLVDKFDLIFIDGEHSYDGTLIDIINCFKLAHSDTRVLIDDIVFEKDNQAVWNCEATRAYKKCIDMDILIELTGETYEYGRGMVMCQYNLAKYNNVDLFRLISSSNYTYLLYLMRVLMNTPKEHNKMVTYFLETRLIDEIDKKNRYRSKEGYTFQIRKLFEDMIDICVNANIKSSGKILEIGFLYGSSTLMFLTNTDASVLSIDNYYDDTVEFARNYISNLYPDRFKLIHGNSYDIIPSLKDLYDLIFIDGNHDYETVLSDVMQCKKHVHKDTIIIMNDVITDERDGMMCWNAGPTNVYKLLLSSNMVNVVYSKTYDVGHGIVAFKLQ